uniref:Uncharacterized protein n=1 Tax=viral metagenome TaxID=1070528 RepID=A0A6C0KPM4_9ZZZZ
MNYIIEALFVGIYTSLVYIFFTYFLIIDNFYIGLLVVGFVKHFLGDFLGLHTFYCNNGEACVKVLNPSKKYISISKNLIIISVGESIMFLILGTIFRPFFPHKYIFLYFTIGAILHILAEKFKIHTFFCKNNCYNEVKKNISFNSH